MLSLVKPPSGWPPPLVVFGASHRSNVHLLPPRSITGAVALVQAQGRRLETPYAIKTSGTKEKETNLLLPDPEPLCNLLKGPEGHFLEIDVCQTMADTYDTGARFGTGAYAAAVQSAKAAYEAGAALSDELLRGFYALSQPGHPLGMGGFDDDDGGGNWGSTHPK